MAKGGDRGSLYQEVTDRIVAELEAGRVLREDNRAIFRVASQASKASDFILAFAEAAKPDAEKVAA